ncbi:MAG: ureidoglycolate lyase [Rhodoferax sp.]|uniref:ureidoglycolate lyase n=1 Tax=Rhodoferax sp. TaxID=50421 RepID=UPI003264591C
MPTLTIEPLTADAFRPFGEVIEANDSARHFSINDGFAERYHDLAHIDVASGGGRAIVSIFRALPRSLPMQLVLLERHPLGSQAFMPLSGLPYLVVVAEAGPVPDLAQIRCFRAAPGQGVNYAKGTWHHPLIALQAPSDFLVVDRGGKPGDANCDEHPLMGEAIWIKP